MSEIICVTCLAESMALSMCSINLTLIIGAQPSTPGFPLPNQDLLEPSEPGFFLFSFSVPE